MQLLAAVSDLVRINGHDQNYACCTAFLGHPAEARLTTADLQRDVRQATSIRFAITLVQGRAWLQQGPLVVLRPTDQSEGEVADETLDVVVNVVGSIDTICSLGYRVLAASAATQQWAVRLRYAGPPGDGLDSLRTHLGASLEEALRGAMQNFLIELPRQPDSR